MKLKRLRNMSDHRIITLEILLTVYLMSSKLRGNIIQVMMTFMLKILGDRIGEEEVTNICTIKDTILDSSLSQIMNTTKDQEEVVTSKTNMNLITTNQNHRDNTDKITIKIINEALMVLIMKKVDIITTANILVMNRENRDRNTTRHVRTREVVKP